MKQRTKPRDCFRAQPNLEIVACDTPRCPRRHSCLRWKVHQYAKKQGTDTWHADFSQCTPPHYRYYYPEE